ncbi:hypothetical protein [Cupriavidus necator]|uniref:hypothetical protein n=1 Tax=Cupriavidus necator TaxID=106590 RepID=UPI00067506D1|nr:hypothetical protein [Cupriavidus necator]MDX6008265.1 hypothetical protein [Cupriavidus necator]
MDSIAQDDPHALHVRQLRDVLRQHRTVQPNRGREERRKDRRHFDLEARTIGRRSPYAGRQPACRPKAEQIKQLAQFPLRWRAGTHQQPIEQVQNGSSGLRVQRQAGQHHWHDDRQQLKVGIAQKAIAMSWRVLASPTAAECHTCAGRTEQHGACNARLQKGAAGEIEINFIDSHGSLLKRNVVLE